MDRGQIIAILRRHEPELRALGIEHLSLFGSVARDSATEASDVDFVVQMAPGPRGFHRLERLDAVQHRLAELLRRPVEEPARSAQVQRAIERDRAPAF